MQINNPAVFNDDESLFSICLGALFSDDPKESMLDTLRADIIAFVRWMDSKIANSAKQNDVTILAKRLSKVWQIEGRPFFENLLGETYDLSDSEESIKYMEFGAVGEMSKDYVEKVLKNKKMKSESVLANDWQKGIGKALELRLEFVQDDDRHIMLSSKVPGGDGTFPPEWLQETQRQLFWKLITENDKFSLKLKEEINSPERAERLCQFFGDETKAAEILRFLGLDEMVNILPGKSYADESEKIENGGDKKATKKRKAKKKKGNGGNLNAIQTPILAENANFGTSHASEAAAGPAENRESFKTALCGQEVTELGMESQELSEKSVQANLEENSEFCEISETAKQTEEEGQISVTKIEDFADDGFLSSKYLAFIRILVLENKSTKIENDKLLTNDLKNVDKRSKKEWNNHGKHTNSCGEHLEALSKLLNVGVFANEISLRLEVIRELGNDFDIIKKSERREFEQIWGKMKRQKLTKDSDWQQIGQNLHNLLKHILNAMDKVERILKAENIGVEMAELAKLLHFHKFARAVVDNGTIWSGLSREQRDTATLALFKAEGNENGAFGRKGGSNFLEKCKQMQLQRRIDKALYAQYKNEFESRNFSDPNYSIDEMREIFQNWCSDAIFDISTRHLLSFQNDTIKAICILPDGFALDRVLGQEICNLESRQMCRSNSVYCHICRNANVSFLRKLWRDLVTDVPMLKITFFGIPMEILVAIVPSIGQFPFGQINARQIVTILRILAQNVDRSMRADNVFDEGIYKLDQNWHSNEMNRLNKELQNAENGDQASEIVDKITVLNDRSEMLARERAKVLRERGEVKTRRGMLHVLGDFGTYAQILHFLLNGEDESLDTNSDDKFKIDDEIGQNNSTMDKFRLIIAYLIKWAKNNHIYSEDFGYLDAKILLILLTKIFLLYPDASLPFLVQKFFLTFSAWHWPVPVQLAEIGHGRRGDFLSWTPGREWMKRRQENWGKSVQDKMPMPIVTPTFPEENAAKNFNLSTAKVVQNELKKAFEKVRTAPNGIVLPLERTNFIEKYDHFIVVQCNAEHDTENVHNFIGKSLRHELLHFIENPLSEWVRFCHVLPRSFTVAECDSPIDQKNGEDLKYDNFQLQSEYVDDRQKLAEWTAFADEQL
uniref:polynucleotide adenylyltransferase n=1 Tax=Globodera rostochiensis TaxID=31243 RepID=A0A914I7U1_GLORO